MPSCGTSAEPVTLSCVPALSEKAVASSGATVGFPSATVLILIVPPVVVPTVREGTLSETPAASGRALIVPPSATVTGVFTVPENALCTA